MTTTEYRAGLSAEDIDGELEALVDTKRCCEWLLCPEAEPAAAGGAGACASATDGLSDQASQVLRAMGGRGGWSTDSLVDETGMKVQLVSVALLELELSARIR